MLALSKILAEPKGIAVGHHDVREPQAGEMLLKVFAAGVCGTDMQIYRDSGALSRRVKLPTILGHEMSGTVDAIGAGVTAVKVGDFVSLESHIPCWTCLACRTGRSHVCPNTRYPGIDLDGCFAEYVTVPASIAWVNPPGVDRHMAALLEPLGIAVHAALEGSGVSGQTVVVNGCGPIGLMNVAVARHYGAHRVIGIDPNPLRRRAAERLGADAVIDPANASPTSAVNDLTGGEGADVVFEYTGSHEGVRNCFAMVGTLGQIRWCATPGTPMDFDFGVWRRARPTIFNITGRKIWQTWERAAPLVYDGKIDFSLIASHKVPLADAVSAFELVESGQALKPLIVC